MSSITLTCKEFGSLIDLAAQANVPLGQAYRMTELLTRAIQLAQGGEEYAVGLIPVKTPDAPQ